MHKKSALILIADTTPYKKIISTSFLCIFCGFMYFYPLLERVFSFPACERVTEFFIQRLKMYFLQNFDRSKTRFYQYVLYCFISIFPVFFHFLQTMHKKSALILIADTTPYKKIISTFFCIFCGFMYFYPLLERVFSSPACERATDFLFKV